MAPMMMASQARADDNADVEFVFEITRTEAEWRARLSAWEYRILREGGTEPHFSSALWNEERPGQYSCRGCDLPLYNSEHKTIRQIGWVFYFHAIPNSVLLGMDESPAQYGSADQMADSPQILIEAHCRRCGSHLGHILNVQGDVLHCINGAALAFAPAA